MTTTAEQEAEIIRLHFAEHWRVGTIASQLGVHPDVVRRVLGIGVGAAGAMAPRPRLCDPYLDFIVETLARYPRLRSTRLYDMLRERGYKGAARTLREYVVPIRPAPRREVYLRTEPLVGEQAQIDWAFAGKLTVAGGERGLWLFVIEVASHRAALLAERRAAADLKGRDRLRSVAPGFSTLLERWALAGPSLAVQVMRAIKLLDLYGDEIFSTAVAEVLARGLRDNGALAVACDRLRRDRRRPVPVEVLLPAHIEDGDVIPHDLQRYDDHD